MSGNREKVIEAATHQIQRGIIDDFSNSLARNFRNSKSVNYIPGKRKRLPTPDFIFQ